MSRQMGSEGRKSRDNPRLSSVYDTTEFSSFRLNSTANPWEAIKTPHQRGFRFGGGSPSKTRTYTPKAQSRRESISTQTIIDRILDTKSRQNLESHLDEAWRVINEKAYRIRQKVAKEDRKRQSAEHAAAAESANSNRVEATILSPRPEKKTHRIRTGKSSVKGGGDDVAVISVRTPQKKTAEDLSSKFAAATLSAQSSRSRNSSLKTKH